MNLTKMDGVKEFQELTEKELQIKLASYLSRYFNVEMEVWTIDHKFRIDIVMIHKSDISKQFPIGIEIKTNDKKTGSLLGQWLKQSNNYAFQTFVNYGRVMVITYPQISDKCLAEGMLMHKHNVNEPGSLAHQHNVNTFLGQFKIGELQRYWFNEREYIRIVFNALLIWDGRKDEFRESNYIKSCR